MRKGAMFQHISEYTGPLTEQIDLAFEEAHRVRSPNEFLPSMLLMWDSGINFREPGALSRYLQWLRARNAKPPVA